MSTLCDNVCIETNNGDDMDIILVIKDLSKRMHTNKLKQLQLEEYLLMQLVFETEDLGVRSKALERKKDIDKQTIEMLGG